MRNDPGDKKMATTALKAVPPIKSTTTPTTDLSVLFPGSDLYLYSVQDDVNKANLDRVKRLKKKIVDNGNDEGINVPPGRPDCVPNGRALLTDLEKHVDFYTPGTLTGWVHVTHLKKDKRQRVTITSAVWQNLMRHLGFDYDCAGTVDVIVYPPEVDPEQHFRTWDGWHRVFKCRLGILDSAKQWVYAKVTVLDYKEYKTREACDKRARELFEARNHYNRKVQTEQIFSVGVFGEDPIKKATFDSLLMCDLVVKPHAQLIEDGRADAVIIGIRQFEVASKNYSDNDGEYLRIASPFSSYYDKMNLAEMAFKFVTGLYHKEGQIAGYLGFGMTRFLDAFGEQIDVDKFVQFMDLHSQLNPQEAWVNNVIKGAEPAHIAVKIANNFDEWMITEGHYKPRGKKRYIPSSDISREFEDELPRNILSTKSNSFEDKLYKQAGEWVKAYKVGSRVKYDEFVSVADEAFEETFDYYDYDE